MNKSGEDLVRLGAYAGFISRLLAWIVDRVLISVVFGIVSFSGDYIINRFAPDNVTVTAIVVIVVVIVNITIYFLYFIGGWMIAGQTLGKALFGLRVVRVDGSRLKLRNAFARLIFSWLSSLGLYLGYLWVLVDKRRRAFHDHLGGTIVVYSETWEQRAYEKTLLNTSIASAK